jgi:hypothetical protein
MREEEITIRRTNKKDRKGRREGVKEINVRTFI